MSELTELSNAKSLEQGLWLDNCLAIIVFVFKVLGIQFRASGMLGKGSPIELCV